jgi:hypothetical protein
VIRRDSRSKIGWYAPRAHRLQRAAQVTLEAFAMRHLCLQQVSNSAYRALPSTFALYMAASASRSIWMACVAQALKVMPMLALVVMSVPAIRNGPAEHVEQPLGERHGIVLGAGSSVRIANSSPRGARPGRSGARLLDAARHGDQELVADGVPRLSLTSLNWSKSRNMRLNLPRRLRAWQGRVAARARPGSGAGSARGQAVVERDVVQPGLGLAPRGDVVQLEDQAGRRAFDVRDEAAVHGCPHTSPSPWRSCSSTENESTCFAFNSAGDRRVGRRRPRRRSR